MKILFLGDVYGRSGRDGLAKHLPYLKEKLKPDALIVNVDNAASGRGVTPKIAQEILDMGVDCLTGGDHIWDQREMICGVENMKNVLRPANLPVGTPGRGVWTATLNGHTLTVLHLCGTVFMNGLFDNAFGYADEFLSHNKLGKGVHIFVDFHAEATSEKMALGQYLNGRVSAVIGTHTHLPTADCQIFSQGTAFQGDAGMCGDYDSVIGVKADVPIQNFLRKVPQERFQPAEGDATICGTFIQTDNNTGLALRIEPVRIGGRLSQQIPES